MKFTILPNLVLYKSSRVSTVHKLGILAVRIFSIYNKKRYKVLKFFGPIKGSIIKVSKNKGFLLSYRLKGYIVQTKKTKLKFDGTSLNFYKNKTYVKSKRFGKKKTNYGCIQKNVNKRKILYKFVCALKCLIIIK